MRKHIFLLVAVLILTTVPAWADGDGGDKNLFNHMSLGLNIGTNGVGADIGLPITNLFAFRAGYNWVPRLKFSDEFDVESPGGGYGGSVDMEAKLNMGTAHALFDVYPIRNHGFHITAGAYFGADGVIDVYNKVPGSLKDVYEHNQTSPNTAGVGFGDYLLTPDKNGNVNADLRVNKFRPYLGIGFGHAVPKGRFTCQFDMGVQFWAKPSVWINGANGEHKVEKSDLDGESAKAFNIATKFSVYPVINLRIVGRLF